MAKRPRPAASRLPGPAGELLHRTADQFTGLLGRVSLDDLLAESARVVERAFVAAALDRTGGNRSQAAELLGLSRQNLYARLRRHALAAPEGRPR